MWCCKHVGLRGMVEGVLAISQALSSKAALWPMVSIAPASFSEDRGQKTEDRRQKTEDRGQRTEDRIPPFLVVKLLSSSKEI